MNRVSRAATAAIAVTLTLASGGLTGATAQSGGLGSAYRFDVYNDPAKTDLAYQDVSQCFRDPNSPSGWYAGEPYLSTSYVDREYLGECYQEGPFLPRGHP